MKIGIASTAERRDHLSVLLARAAKGEDAAFSELYALTNRKMRSTACAVLPRGAEVEDILQDAYLKIWRNAPHFNPDRSSPISWMTAGQRSELSAPMGTALSPARCRLPAPFSPRTPTRSPPETSSGTAFGPLRADGSKKRLSRGVPIVLLKNPGR